MQNPQQIEELLALHYPDQRSLLNYSNPFELLVAVILSAQCTDAMVNRVTPALFEAYPDPSAMAEAPIEHLEELVRRTGFYKNKAKNIKAASTRLIQDHKGEVPHDLKSLISLPGVGRKTANVVRGHLWEEPGIIVDTHFGRVVRRLGFTKETDPVKVEKAIEKILPRDKWLRISMTANYHGRDLCKSRKPLCGDCFLLEFCPSGKIS